MGSSKKGKIKDTGKVKEADEKKKEEKKEKPKFEKKIEQRELVRVANTDLIGDKPLVEAIKGIKGVSHTFAKAVLLAANLPLKEKLLSLKAEQIEKLEQVIKTPAQFGVSPYLLNRQKDMATGQDAHLIGQDLTVQQKFDIQRSIDLKTYRGFRHILGQPVRGQRTRSHFRGKGRVVGVMRKAIRAQMCKTGEAATAQAGATAPAKNDEKKEEKK